MDICVQQLSLIPTECSKSRSLSGELSEAQLFIEMSLIGDTRRLSGEAERMKSFGTELVECCPKGDMPTSPLEKLWGSTL